MVKYNLEKVGNVLDHVASKQLRQTASKDRLCSRALLSGMVTIEVPKDQNTMTCEDNGIDERPRSFNQLS